MGAKYIMTKKTMMKWRLSKLPTPDEIMNLVSNKILTQEEAREILFSSTEEDTESLKSEIKFLRELINKLSTQTKIVENIRYIERPYYQYPWWGQYSSYCSASGNQSGGIAGPGIGTLYLNGQGITTSGSNSITANSALAQTQANVGLSNLSTSVGSFTDIKTF